MPDGGLLDLDRPRRQIDDPLAELLQVAADALELVDALRSVVGELRSVATDATSAYGSHVAPQITAYVAALRTAEKTLTNIARLGIADRVVKLDEERVRILVAVIEGSLYALGVNPHTEEVRDTIARQIKLQAGLASS